MKKSYKTLIFLIIYLAYTSIYIARVNLSQAGPELINLGVLDETSLGLLGSVFSTVFSVGRLINGGLSDKTPPFIMISTGLALAGISNALISFLPPFIAIFLLWMVNSFAPSMLWSSVLCVVSSIYEGKTAKRKTSIMVTSVATGNILGIILNTFVITEFGVGYAFLVPGGITLILGLAVLLTARKIPAPTAQNGKKQKSMFQLIKNPELLFMLIPALFHGVMKENVTLWMTVFIVDTYVVNLSESAYFIFLIPVIALIGRTAYSFVYKLFKENENTVSVFGFGLCIVSAAVLCLVKTNMVVSVIMLSLVYTAASMINTSMLSIYPMNFLKSGNVASVSGIMDFATYLGAGVSAAIYGVVIKNLGFVPMFISWIVISVISAVIIIKINANNRKKTVG